MSNLTTNQRECAAIITALIDEQITQAQRTRLNELCREDPLCRKLYTAVMSVHGMLLWSSELSAKQHEEIGDESGVLLMEIYEQARLSRIKLDAELELAKNQKAQALEASQRKQRSIDEAKPRSLVLIIPRAAVYSGLAAAILLAMVLLWPVFQNIGQATDPASGTDIAVVDPEVESKVVPEARLVRTHDASWAQPISDDGVFAGDGVWTLNEGFAEIAMPSGASVVLQGPTTFRLIDDNALALDDGRLTAEVPDRAKYFTVKTKAMDVVDLGTRFGITIQEDGSASTGVLEGKVEVHETASVDPDVPKKKVALVAGQQLDADADGQLAETITAIRPDHGYVARWETIQRRVIIDGQARFFNTPPKSVRHGELGSTNSMIVFEESFIVLDEPLSLMVNLPQEQAATFTTAPAGRRVVSYFIHSEPAAEDDSSYATATLTFPGRVLGVLGNTQQLRGTNAIFGLSDVEYIPDDDRSTYALDPQTPDHFAIGGVQGNVLTIHLAAGKFADQARVLVELPDAIDTK